MKKEKKTSQILSESVKHKIKLMIKKLSTKEINGINLKELLNHNLGIKF